MITVTEARNIVLACCSEPLPVIELPIVAAVGYTLAEAVYSQIRIPGFYQSSMDGFAINWAEKEEALIIQDELPAGTGKQLRLEKGKAVKVFTGGPVPEHADTVIPKERVTVTGNLVRIHAGYERMDHIREPGSAIEQGALVLAAGTLLKPMHIGLLASVGIAMIAVYRKPAVAILITGNELVQPGHPLQFGQVYESNSFGLIACLQELNITKPGLFFAKDLLEATAEQINAALEGHEILLITGGVSVGEYDHVAKACEMQGILPRFHGVKQRPGKPLYFGTKSGKLVFGLPGNPASVLSCFYQYVLPAIRQLTGSPVSIISKKVRLTSAYAKKPALTFFLKGFEENGKVSILPGQASFQLDAFREANCWIELAENHFNFEQEEAVTIYPFL